MTGALGPTSRVLLASPTSPHPVTESTLEMHGPATGTSVPWPVSPSPSATWGRHSVFHTSGLLIISGTPFDTQVRLLLLTAWNVETPSPPTRSFVSVISRKAPHSTVTESLSSVDKTEFACVTSLEFYLKFPVHRVRGFLLRVWVYGAHL